MDLLLTTALMALAGGGGPDFHRDVRPLLSDRCFPCHGPDRGSRQAGLRLDVPEAHDFEHEGRRALVPGDPDGSELVRRIRSADPSLRMPPPDSGLSLSEAEQEQLVAWVAAGAEYEPHWAFVPPEAPEIPRGSSWSRTPVDRFVEARLEREGLRPAPDADPATLARRLYLDLLGLPPTPEQLDAFERDHQRDPEGAYRALVERLLATPQHAERLALQWLDAARYADTNGFHHDNVRTAWPWRDWVLRAFHENLPYDEFVTLQLAGDLLPDAGEQDRIATAFARMHNINDEGGALDEEYRVEAVADRIETVATVFLGLTFTCARCHDHKYDPFTQEDYYSLYAFFNSVEERGVYPNDFEAARAYPARLEYVPEGLRAELADAEDAVRRARSAREAAAPEVAREQERFEDDLRSELGLAWAGAELLDARSSAGAELALVDGALLASGPNPDRDVHELHLATEATDLTLLRLDARPHPSLPHGRVGRAPNGNAVLSHVSLEVRSRLDPSLRQEVRWRWAWADFEQANGDFDALGAIDPDPLGWAVGAHVREGGRTLLLVAEEPFGFEGGSDLRLSLHYESPYAQHTLGHVAVDVASAAPAVLEQFPTIERDWFLCGPHGAPSFDAAWERDLGPEDIARLDLAQRFGERGWNHRPDFEDGRVHRLDGERSSFYLARSVFTPVARELDLSLGSDDALRVHLNGREVHSNPARRGAAPDQDRVRVALEPGENVLVLEVVNDGGPAGFYQRSTPVAQAVPRLMPVALLPPGTVEGALLEEYRTEWRRLRSPTYLRLDEALAAAEQRVAELRDQSVPVLVMRELPEPTPTHVLSRGSYQLPDPERPVQRRTPLALPVAWPEGAPLDRLGFARWLVRPDHPLTARVRVNQLWQMLFGTGLVASAENFGLQAELPSHPELLDWLALRLVELGWDQRALLREIVTSSVYRQAARRDPLARELDPGNRLLASFPRRRLPAEHVRDLALAASGLLVDRVGGPSVRPYQPEGLWREVSIGGSSNTQVFRPGSGEDLWRRSLYTFWKRTSPPPQMALFDAPTREFCLVDRTTTNTPLQALVLWNDEQFVEAARALATRTLREERDTDRRLARLYRRCTGRRADGEDLAALRALLDDLTGSLSARPDDAAALLEVGELAPPDDLDPRELAAWTLVASTVLSLDETLVRD